MQNVNTKNSRSVGSPDSRVMNENALCSPATPLANYRRENRLGYKTLRRIAFLNTMRHHTDSQITGEKNMGNNSLTLI